MSKIARNVDGCNSVTKTYRVAERIEKPPHAAYKRLS